MCVGASVGRGFLFPPRDALGHREAGKERCGLVVWPRFYRRAAFKKLHLQMVGGKMGGVLSLWPRKRGQSDKTGKWLGRSIKHSNPQRSCLEKKQEDREMTQPLSGLGSVALWTPG